MKILSARQIKELDAYTIQHEPIASIDLMERACSAFVNWFTDHVESTRKIGIVCGTGNNGGDGLGIARMLNDWGYPVKVWIVRGLVPESGDFKINLSRLIGKLDCSDIVTEPEKEIFDDREVLIDAVFGTGLSRTPEGIYAHVIESMNRATAVRIAVDIPSGLSANDHSAGSILKADYTISFQLPKLAFLLPQNHQYVGQWTTVDIGLQKEFIQNTKSVYFYITQKDARKTLKPRSAFDHKGKYGHALLISGSYGKMGAAILASRAALRSGLGLLTVHVPKTGYTILQTAVPEAMTSTDEHDFVFTGITSVEKFGAMGVGPGVGTSKETVKGFSTLMDSFRKPMVIDADGLNILSANRELLHLIPENSILTPHPGEFERLVGSWRNDFERLKKQQALAIQLKSVIVLKGANTSIATPEGVVYFNSTGNPGMATGGSGDVLTGMLMSFLAQSYSSVQASILGVYLHGLSGDFAAREKGMDALIASDIVDFLPEAFRKIIR
ncbi:MAG: NAD(P)H-hydrate dehydratase [Cyclobacteriaceae bacterium]|nr:NAD(P)H-hydrate dehydratase [Cyclobacteriaceae bacterium]